MDILQNYIRKQVSKKLSEQEKEPFVAVPYVIQPVILKIGLFPFNRYIKEVKHANSIPPSEEVVLKNGESFYVYLEGNDKEIEINGERFFTQDKRNLYLIRDKINELLKKPKIVPSDDEESEEVSFSPPETPSPSPNEEEPPT